MQHIAADHANVVNADSIALSDDTAACGFERFRLEAATRCLGITRVWFMVTWSCALEHLWLVQATETEVYLSPSAGDGCRGSQITKIHEAVSPSLFHQSLNEKHPVGAFYIVFARVIIRILRHVNALFFMLGCHTCSARLSTRRCGMV
jgi:hypothetical protein